uniref:Ig-like domain-containing protein n=1 Tax=Monopterus albus TaxID=43700 RepID=A0A3Q3JKN6_MONAL
KGEMYLHENVFLDFIVCWSFLEPPIKFLQELKNIQVQEGGGVTLCCELSKPGTPVQWKKGNKVLTSGEKYQMKQSGSLVELLIRKSQPEDSGTYKESDAGKYTCKTQDSQSTAELTVKGKMEILQNQQVEEENNLTLSCELSKPGLAVEWRKGEELLKNNFKYHIKDRNSIMDLTIKNTQLEDSGLYSCNYGDVKTTELQGVEVEEGGSASLYCELSKLGVPIQWKKNRMALRASRKYEMRQNGCFLQLHINNLKLEDSGSYSCQAGSAETTATLTVQGISTSWSLHLRTVAVCECGNLLYMVTFIVSARCNSWKPIFK